MAFCSKSHGTTLERIADTAERTDRRVAAVVRRVRKTTGGKPDQFVQKLILWLIIANVAGAVAGALGKEGLELLLRALGTPAGG